MLSSIGKLSKSILIKVLVAIIILPFIFWGMGDVFRGGNQNVVATIDSEKISSKEFVEHVNRISLNEEQIKNIKDSDLIEKILSDYIGRKLIELEVKDFNITISDKTLREIIINDETFFKDGKFSRLKYEEFLIKNNLSAPLFEDNILQQEKKRQLLSYLSDGARIPEYLTKYEFNKENQTKKIKYIDLKDYYAQKKINEDEFKKTYELNKNAFNEEFKSFQYIKLSPEALIGKKEADEQYFKLIDKIENNILDGSTLKIISEENNLKINKIEEISLSTIEKKKNSNLLKKFFVINEQGKSRLFKIENKYYVAELSKKRTETKNIENPEVREAITAQLKFMTKFKENNEIAKKISKNQNINFIKSFAQKNNLEVKELLILGLNDNKKFKTNVIRRIFETKDGETNLISDNTFSDNFIILTEKTNLKKFDKNSPKYNEYFTKAKLNFAQNIYSSYDKSLNSKYQIKVNEGVLNRIKNSF